MENMLITRLKPLFMEIILPDRIFMEIMWNKIINQLLELMGLKHILGRVDASIYRWEMIGTALGTVPISRLKSPSEMMQCGAPQWCERWFKQTYWGL